MAAKVYYSPFIPAFSSNGLPVAGAFLYFYYSETETPAPIYTDEALTVPLTNPVQADLAARFPAIYLDDTIEYRVRITDANRTPLGADIDPYIPGEALKGDRGEVGPRGFTDTFPRSAINSFLPLVTWLTSYYQGSGEQTLFYDFGSSVGNGAGQGPNAGTNNPGAYFFARAKEFFDPFNIFNFTRINGSVNGSTIAGLGGMEEKWRTVIAPLNPKVSFGVPGMNDFQISGFNTGATFNPFTGSPAALRELLRKAQQTGCVVVLSTTPHQDVTKVDYSFFEANPGVPMAYPAVVPAPVPASAVIPSKANAKPFIQWKGETIQVDARFLRGNDMIRRVAAEFGVPVIDAERKQFDLLAAGYTYADMYDPGETVHPNDWAISQTYNAATDDLFRGMRADYVLAAQPSAVGPRLGVNADETAPYALRVAPSNDDDVALFENASGVDLLTIDKLGNINQTAGDTTRLSPKVLRRTGVDPALGEKQDGFAGAPNTGVAQSFTVPANSNGVLWVGAKRSDLGDRTALATWYSDGATVTLGAEFGATGSPVTPIYNVSVSGLTITYTPTGANTRIKIRPFEIW